MEFLIGSRTNRPGDDPIFALNAEARTRILAGEAIVNATVGALLDDDGRLAVLGTVVETLREVSAETGAAYAPIAGNPDFLRAVVHDLFGAGPAADWAVAVATPGGSGALRLALANLLEAHQTLLTTSHYWGPYATLADETERALGTFRMFDDAGRLDVDDFARKLSVLLDQQGRALVFLNSPCHNPTGYSLEDDEWDAVVDVVERASKRGPISLVVDIAYARYGARGLTGMLERLQRLAGKALVGFSWSASKSFTQYGLRVGAFVALHPDAAQRRRLQNAFVYTCRGTWSNCNAAGMAAIARLLSDADLRARVEQERAGLKAVLDRRVARWNELASRAGLRYPRYHGGFFTTVFCADAADIAGRLKGEGIFVVPSAGGLRIALCSVAERDVPRLVDGIAKHVGAAAGPGA